MDGWAGSTEVLSGPHREPVRNTACAAFYRESEDTGGSHQTSPAPQRPKRTSDASGVME